MNNSFIFTALNKDDREAFDRIVFRGKLGTPATPYEEFITYSSPFRVQQNKVMTLKEAVDSILQSHPKESGYILAVSSEKSVTPYELAIYKENKLLIGETLIDVCADNRTEILYMETRSEFTNWIVKIEDFDDVKPV